MPFTFTLPQTAYEALVMLVPFLTALLGLAYFLFPKAMMTSSGLSPANDKPDAIAEGRATYGGTLLAFGLCCLMLQEPRALQPGLNTMLAIAWLIAGVGFLAHMVLVRQFDVPSIVRLVLAFAFFIIAWTTSDPVTFGLVLPTNAQEWIFAVIAAFTIALGLVALLLPKLALRIMRLQISEEQPVCICGPRGIVAGFYIAAGIGLFIIQEPIVAAIWLQVLLGTVWLFTGLGRFVSMVFDGKFPIGFSFYNIAGAIFELALGIYVIGTVFGLF